MLKESLSRIDPSWKSALLPEMEKPYMENLRNFLEQENTKGASIFPPQEDIFNALIQTPLQDVKVVIIGQDPYHGEGQAHGLSFSVQKGVRLPPSLRNIYKEIELEYGVWPSKDGDLTGWAKQGVLLLNATLSVESGLAASHQKKGWEHFTDKIIHTVNETCDRTVFLLWGSHAQKKASFIDRERHLVLESPHPSPLSAHRGFLGCGHFKKANDYLAANGRTEINWLALQDWHAHVANAA